VVGAAPFLGATWQRRRRARKYRAKADALAATGLVNRYFFILWKKLFFKLMLDIYYVDVIL
jgi:hypothetical protein